MKDLQRDKYIKGLSKYYKAYGLHNFVSTVLQDMGYLDRKARSVFVFTFNGEIDDDIVDEVADAYLARCKEKISNDFSLYYQMARFANACGYNSNTPVGDMIAFLGDGNSQIGAIRFKKQFEEAWS